MTSSSEPMYCSQQITIPPELPNILKQFTKAAIRTQPSDVLQWAAAYFSALANGEKPPVKERLAFQFGEVNDNALSKESISVLHRQLGDKPVVELSKVRDKWQALCLQNGQLNDIMRLGSFAEEFEWLKFLVLACSSVSPNIAVALQNLCEIITHDLEGGRARIPFDTFKELYRYLASIDGDIPVSHVNEVLDHLSYDVERQSGMIAPRNFMSDSCPSLWAHS